jgi:hypothetical protein
MGSLSSQEVLGLIPTVEDLSDQTASLQEAAQLPAGAISTEARIAAMAMLKTVSLGSAEKTSDWINYLSELNQRVESSRGEAVAWLSSDIELEGCQIARSRQTTVHLLNIATLPTDASLELVPGSTTAIQIHAEGIANTKISPLWLEVVAEGRLDLANFHLYERLKPLYSPTFIDDIWLPERLKETEDFHLLVGDEAVGEMLKAPDPEGYDGSEFDNRETTRRIINEFLSSESAPASLRQPDRV